MTRRLKRFVADVLFHTRLLGVWARVALRRRAVVLMYHRVLPAAERALAGSHPGIVVERETFAWQMDLLKRDFTVLSLAEFREAFEGRRPLPPASCLITFDDGWLDNATHAVPILRERSLPAVVFLPTAFIGRRRMFWREALTQLLTRAVLAGRADGELKGRLRARLQPLGLADVLEVGAASPHARMVDAVTERMSAEAPPAEDVLQGLASDLGLALEDLSGADAFIDWAQASDMAAAGIAIGAHGVEHRLLTALPHSEVRAEVTGSRDALAAAGLPAMAFSYPNGRWDAAVAGEVARAGFALAFTTDGGHVAPGDHAWALRRVNIHEDDTNSPGLFLARILGLN